RCVTIVARGKLGPEEVMGAAQQLFEAKVPEFAKIVDVAGATAEISFEQVERIAALLASTPTIKRGPVAFLIDPKRGEFARGCALGEWCDRCPGRTARRSRDGGAGVRRIGAAQRRRQQQGLAGAQMDEASRCRGQERLEGAWAGAAHRARRPLDRRDRRAAGR